MQLTYPYGATPLETDEIDGLIPDHIQIQKELNEWEQANILEAEFWLSNHHLNSFEILDILFIKKIHDKMFDKTWKWAGYFRKTNKNIGVDWLIISQELKLFLDDIQYQISQLSYSFDEIAVRFHHRLVSIHPFSNGNGRHARLMTDLLLKSVGQSKFSWGQKMQDKYSVVRKKYIDALRAADALKDYRPLLDFVRK